MLVLRINGIYFPTQHFTTKSLRCRLSSVRCKTVTRFLNICYLTSVVDRVIHCKCCDYDKRDVIYCKCCDCDKGDVIYCKCCDFEKRDVIYCKCCDYDKRDVLKAVSVLQNIYKCPRPRRWEFYGLHGVKNRNPNRRLN